MVFVVDDGGFTLRVSPIIDNEVSPESVVICNIDKQTATPVVEVCPSGVFTVRYGKVELQMKLIDLNLVFSVIDDGVIVDENSHFVGTN